MLNIIEYDMIENKKGGVFSLRYNKITPIPEKTITVIFF